MVKPSHPRRKAAVVNAASSVAPKRRLPREERERLIVEGAIRFFAEVGFEGQTRALADRLGVTQPLLYRYFPDKESLIERVYHEVYLSRWNPEWEVLLADRTKPLHDRLVTFYSQYSSAIFNYEWVRIFMFSGLKDVNINERYLSIIRERVLAPVCAELRSRAGLPSVEQEPLTDAELESAWALHGSIFYIAIRKWIYHLPVKDDIDDIIETQVAAFLDGAPQAMRRLRSGV